MMKRGLSTFLFLSGAGLLLGTLGTWAVPLGHGMSAFWPAFVVQTAGGAWFGGWGVLAAVFFPVFTNALAQVGLSGMLGFIPANLAQGIIPAWAFRHYGVDPAIPGRRGLAFYLLWGALIPAFSGGVLGSAAVVFFGEAAWSDYPLMVVKWAAPHTLVALVIGVPVMRVLTPLWRDLGDLVKGWWAFDQEKMRPGGPHRFRDMPIQLKLVLAMCGAGLGPLLVLSLLELTNQTGKSTPENLMPLFLTISLVALILAVGILSRETVRPLRELKDQVEALVQSRDGVLTVERADEIGQLGRSFALLLDERRRLFEQLSEVDKLKDQFIRMTAHEIKTPVTIVKAYAQAALAMSGQNAPALRVKLEAIDRGADRITRIVSDMLDVTQVKFGKLKMQNMPFDLPALVTDVSKNLMLTDAVKHRIFVGGAQSATVMGDPLRTEQVLTNILSNALKHSPPGRDADISVDIQVEGSVAIVAVRDHGIGIPEAQQQHVFEPFFRAHAETKDDYGGMGIGLFLSREFVQAQGGTIGFTSEEGRGSTFFFHLPLAPSKTEKPILHESKADF